MRGAILIAVAAASTLTAGCETSRDRYGEEWSSYRSYDFNRPDPRYDGYYADRYYRESPKYRERRLSRNDRIYRGQDGRYYCRRSDGTTGLIVGAIAGGALGNLIAPGRSETLGTIIGAVAGGLIGREVSRKVLAVANPFAVDEHLWGGFDPLLGFEGVDFVTRGEHPVVDREAIVLEQFLRLHSERAGVIGEHHPVQDCVALVGHGELHVSGSSAPAAPWFRRGELPA